MELETQWWAARGVEADVLWSNNVAFQSQFLEDPYLANAREARQGDGAGRDALEVDAGDE